MGWEMPIFDRQSFDIAQTEKFGTSFSAILLALSLFRYASLLYSANLKFLPNICSLANQWGVFTSLWREDPPTFERLSIISSSYPSLSLTHDIHSSTFPHTHTRLQNSPAEIPLLEFFHSIFIATGLANESHWSPGTFFGHLYQPLDGLGTPRVWPIEVSKTQLKALVSYSGIPVGEWNSTFALSISDFVFCIECSIQPRSVSYLGSSTASMILQGQAVGFLEATGGRLFFFTLPVIFMASDDPKWVIVVALYPGTDWSTVFSECFPALIPIVLSRPSGRSWRSLSTQVLSTYPAYLRLYLLCGCCCWVTAMPSPMLLFNTRKEAELVVFLRGLVHLSWYLERHIIGVLRD
jgi:hypothetical protein